MYLYDCPSCGNSTVLKEQRHLLGAWPLAAGGGEAWPLDARRRRLYLLGWGAWPLPAVGVGGVDSTC